MAYSVAESLKKKKDETYSVAASLQKKDEEQAVRDNALSQFLGGILNREKEEEATAAKPAAVAAPLSGGKKFSPTDVVGKYQATHGDNAILAQDPRYKMRFTNVELEQQKREAADDAIDELLGRQQAAQREMEFFDSGEFKGPQYLAAEQIYNQIQQQIAEENQKAMSQQQIDEIKAFQEMERWQSVTGRKGFADASAYAKNDDLRYNVINRDPEAVAKSHEEAAKYNLDIAGVDMGHLEQMTDEEIGLYNYYYSTVGKEKADEYLASIESDLKARRMGDRREWYREYAEQNPVAASAFSVLTSPVRGLSYVGQAADYLKNGKMDANESYNIFTRAGSDIRGQVSSDIEKNVEGFWGKAGSFAYNTGMSMGDFLMAAGLSGGVGGIATTIMGTGAAAQTVLDAKDRGLNDDQAFALGTIAGFAEAATEKFSIEALLDRAAMGKGALTYILKNAITEGSEEAASGIINTVADILISKDKSEWAQSVEDYKAQGMSDKEAFWRAVADQAKSIGLDALGGMLSGGLIGSVGAIGNTAAQQAAQPKKGAEVATEMGIGKHGAEAAEKAGITPENVGAFTANYEAGKDGKAFEEVKTAQTGIDENVARQAYNAGQMDAIAEGNTEQEVTENGERAEEIRLRGSGERIYGQNPGGQDQRLVGGTAETERGDGEGGPADRGAAALVTSGKAVTTGSLGIAGGSNEDAVFVVTGGETEATKEAYALAKKRGLRLQLFVGGNLHINGEEARAYISGDRVFVRADHSEYTADQLMIHEETHDMENKGELDVEKVLERLRDTYTEEELDSLAEIYAEVFLNDGKTADEIWIEIIGDSRANMNAFSGTEIEEEFAGLMEDARAAVEETKGEATKAPTNEGRASVETLPDGKKYVKADRQVLFGSDPESWSEQLEDYINGKIRRGENVRLIAEDGQELLLTSRTAGKVSSIYQNDRTMSESAIERKFHAGAHIDELAQVSVRKQRPKKDRDGKHGSEAAGGWEYRKAFFLDFDGKYYECTISAEIAENGITVYNIGQMQERSFPHVQNTLNGSSVDDGAQRGKTSSTDRVFQSDPNVKKDSSATSREISKEAAAKAVERVRARDEKRIAALKANFKAREERARESRNAVQMREKIQNHTKKISKELLRPNDKHHIPEELRGPVAKVLESINNASAFDVEYTKDADYKRVPRGESRYAEATKRTKAFAELKAAYSKIAGELAVDPDLFGADGVPGLFDQIAEMSDKSLSEMNTEELTTVWQAVRAMEASIRSANKLFAQSKFASISEAAYALRNDNAHKAVRKELKGIFGTAQNLTTLDMMTPETFLHEMGQSGEAIFRTLRDAEDKQTEILKAIADFSTKLTEKVDVRKLEKQTHVVTLGGKQVTMSTAQLMELYALSHRQQAADHIFKGGILPEELKRGKGERTIEPVQGITPQELAKAFEILTEEQKHIADEMQQFASTKLSDYGNEASLQVYNYKKFTEENYWPIRSNQNEIRSSVERDTQTTSVANKGFTKTVKPHANTSLKIGSIFDTFANHSTEMAKYAAWLGATEDVNRIRNFTFRDGQGNRVGTVKGLIERVHGAKGAAYLQKLLADIANGIKPVEGEIGGKLTSNVKAAAVGGNMRVVIQQPTAILRAASMINPKYFVGVPSKGGWQKALKYAPIAQWKNWGYYDINTGRQIKDVLFNSDTNLNKARDFTMKGAEVADSASWGWLWNTVEREVAATNKELKKGSEEFYKAVAKRFTEVVDRTQLVDSILHRSQIMRSPSGLTKMATSFMGEPTKQYNMMLMASYDLRRAKDADARKKARSQLAKTTAAMAVSGVVNAAVQSIVDAIRDDDREKEYWEKWLSAFVGTEGDEEGLMETAKAIMGGNAASAFNPAQYVPYAKDVVSLLQGYDVSRMDMDGVEKAISAANNLWKAIRGDGKHTIGGATINFIAEASRVLGVPVANIKRDVLAIAKTVVNASDNYLAQYHMEKALTNFNYSGGTKIALDILYDAYEKNDAAYEIILDDMIGSGVDRDKIRTNMEDRMKKAQGVKSVSELEQRYLFPDEQEDYDRTVKQMKRSDAWKQASSKQKEKVQDYLYDLTVQNADGEDLMEKINPGKQYGLTETEYLLYKLALEVVDNPTDSGKYGTFTNDEVEEAIKMIGLSKEESAYLWDAAGKSDKSNPWK